MWFPVSSSRCWLETPGPGSGSSSRLERAPGSSGWSPASLLSSVLFLSQPAGVKSENIISSRKVQTKLKFNIYVNISSSPALFILINEARDLYFSPVQHKHFNPAHSSQKLGTVNIIFTGLGEIHHRKKSSHSAP